MISKQTISELEQIAKNIENEMKEYVNAEGIVTNKYRYNLRFREALSFHECIGYLKGLNIDHIHYEDKDKEWYVNKLLDVYRSKCEMWSIEKDDAYLEELRGKSFDELEEMYNAL